MTSRYQVLGLAMLLGLGSTGCPSSSPKPERSLTKVVHKEVPARVYFEKASAWLPSDVVAVGVLDVRRLKGMLSFSGWDSRDPKVTKALMARQKKLLTDISRLFRTRFGVDLLEADHIVLGIHKKGVELLVFGLQPDAKATRKTLDGRKLLRLFPNSEPDRAEFQQELWAQVTPDGLALHLPFHGGVPGAPTHATRLRDSERAALFSQALDEAPSTMALAAVLDDPDFEKLAMSLAGLPAPRVVRLSFQKDLTLLVHGDPRFLEFMNTRMEQGKRMMLDRLEKTIVRKDTSKMSTPELLLNLHIRTFLNMLEKGYRVKVEGETLKASLAMPKYETSSSMMLMGTLSAIAIPAFVRSVRKSKTAEAEMRLRRISDAAALYYRTDRYDSSGKLLPCEFPPSAPMTGPIPKNGAKVLPSKISKEWKHYGNLSWNEPLYFAYETSLHTHNPTDLMTLFAYADFDSAKPRYHTISQDLRGLGRVNGACEVEIAPTVTRNEFH